MDPDKLLILCLELIPALRVVPSCFDNGIYHNRYCCKHKFKEGRTEFVYPDDDGVQRTYCFHYSYNSQPVPKVDKNGIEVVTKYCCEHKPKGYGRNKHLVEKICKLTPEEMKEVLITLVSTEY